VRETFVCRTIPKWRYLVDHIHVQQTGEESGVQYGTPLVIAEFDDYLDELGYTPST
jgi:hypothetical protein